MCIASYLFSKEVVRLVNRSGPLFTALYLKQCASSLQMAYGSSKVKPSLLPVPVSLTRGGLPRIIPAFHRHKIRRRDDYSDRLVQLYLSFFSLSKLIELAPKINRSTFSSIVTPVTDLDRVIGFVSKVKEKMKSLLDRYTPYVSSIPVHQGMSWVPTWKAVPSHSTVKVALQQEVEYEGKSPKGMLIRRYLKHRSIFTAVFYELFAFVGLLEFIHARQDHFSPGLLWPPRIRFAFDPMNTFWANKDLDWFERCCGQYLPSPTTQHIPWVGGRLGMSLEGGGKRRVFAIGNYIKQR